MRAGPPAANGAGTGARSANHTLRCPNRNEVQIMAPTARMTRRMMGLVKSRLPGLRPGAGPPRPPGSALGAGHSAHHLGAALSRRLQEFGRNRDAHRGPVAGCQTTYCHTPPRPGHDAARKPACFRSAPNLGGSRPPAPAPNVIHTPVGGGHHSARRPRISPAAETSAIGFQRRVRVASRFRVLRRGSRRRRSKQASPSNDVRAREDGNTHGTPLAW